MSMERHLPWRGSIMKMDVHINDELRVPFNNKFGIVIHFNNI
jgi:hypothetical protein